MNLPASTKTVLMSHLSDFEYGCDSNRINFLKFLLLKFDNTLQDIDPENEYKKYLAGIHGHYQSKALILDGEVFVDGSAVFVESDQYFGTLEFDWDNNVWQIRSMVDESHVNLDVVKNYKILNK